MLNSYKDLRVWQESICLVIEIYRLTALFPKTEVYGITIQMRRAAISIPSNIAEGYTRKYRPEYLQFLRVAFSSGAELETQLIIAKNLKLAPLKEFEKSDELLNKVMRMLNNLMDKLNPKP